jgi:hypothetical protein
VSISVGSNLNFDGRIYSSADLHAGALVWIDRRKVIERLLIKDHPNLSPIDVMDVLRGAELYATCNEDMFKRLEEDA